MTVPVAATRLTLRPRREPPPNRYWLRLTRRSTGAWQLNQNLLPLQRRVEAESSALFNKLSVGVALANKRIDSTLEADYIV